MLKSIEIFAMCWLEKIFFKPGAANPAEFDSRGGTYDEQTEVAFRTQLYMELLPQTLVGSLSKRNNPQVPDVTAFAAPTFDNTTFIWDENVTKGDEVRITLEETSKGLPTHGDIAVDSGDYLAFMSQAFRANMVKSPGFPVHGEESRKLVAKSIVNMPQNTKNSAVTWMAEQMDADFLLSLAWGGDSSLLKPLVDGGKAISQGPGAGIGAGTPLAPMHFYTTDTGFATYTPADLSGWNSTCNDAINGIDAADADKVTLAQLDLIREFLDDQLWMPGMLNGRKYKAICLGDPQCVSRVSTLMHDDHRDAERRGKDNPVFNVNYQLHRDDILYLSVPRLKRYRPAYNASTSMYDVGPGYTSDHRTYTNSETEAWMFFIGAGAVLMGKDGSLDTTRATANHGERDGLEISVRQRMSFKRNQWNTKDGRTESKCYSVLAAAFYEPGVGN